MADIGDRTQFFPNDDDNVTISSGIAAPRIDAQLRKLAGAITREYEFKSYKADRGDSGEIYLSYTQDQLTNLNDGQIISATRTRDASLDIFTASLEFLPSGQLYPGKTIVRRINNSNNQTTADDLNDNKPVEMVYRTSSGFFVRTESEPVAISGGFSGGNHIAFVDGTLIKYGTISITPVANTPTSATVLFGSLQFASTSSMVATVSASTVFPSSSVEQVSYSGVTTSSIDINIYRKTTTATVVSFIVYGRWF
jgi:hypothetical protein